FAHVRRDRVRGGGRRPHRRVRRRREQGGNLLGRGAGEGKWRAVLCRRSDFDARPDAGLGRRDPHRAAGGGGSDARIRSGYRSGRDAGGKSGIRRDAQSLYHGDRHRAWRGARPVYRIAEEVVVLVDVHSHYWEYPEHFSEDFKKQASRARGDTEVDLTVRWEDYQASAEGCDKTVVFGGKAKLSGLWVPDTAVARYAATRPDKLIAFLSLDPTRPGWQEEMFEGHRNLKMKGIKLLP